MSSTIADKALDLCGVIHYFTGTDTEGINMARKQTEKTDFRTNLMLYYGAIGVVILGYVFLAIGDANSITSLTLGPIILVAGYLVAMPVALLRGAKSQKSAEEQPSVSSPKTGQNN